MVTVNDEPVRHDDDFYCWICGAKGDHDGVPHSEATGDGLTRYDIVTHMAWRGVTWRGE